MPRGFQKAADPSTFKNTEGLVWDMDTQTQKHPSYLFQEFSPLKNSFGCLEINPVKQARIMEQKGFGWIGTSQRQVAP